MSRTMSFEDVIAQLEAWGSESYRKMYSRDGAGDNQFGVTLGNLRGLAKQLKTDHGLALQLWTTGNADAMILATMLMAPFCTFRFLSELRGPEKLSHARRPWRGVGLGAPSWATPRIVGTETPYPNFQFNRSILVRSAIASASWSPPKLTSALFGSIIAMQVADELLENANCCCVVSLAPVFLYFSLDFTLQETIGTPMFSAVAQ